MLLLFVLGLLPLILFVVVDYYADLKSGVFSAMIASALLAVATWLIFDEVDYELVGMVLIIAVVGVIAIKKDNSTWFKFQPVISNGVWILILGYYQFFDTPLMIKYLPKLKKVLPPENVEVFSAPGTTEMLSRLSLFLIIWIFLHGLFMAFAAIKLKNRYWLVAKALTVPLITAGSFAFEFLFQITF